MSSKEFCESGKHSYSESDVVRSILHEGSVAYILVACSKCDSKFLKALPIVP